MNFEAWEAKSIIFKEGVLIIPEPFLETIVRWDKDTDSVVIAKGIKKILNMKKAFGDRCHMTDIQYETSYGHPQVVWAIFKEKEDIFISNCIT